MKRADIRYGRIVYAWMADNRGFSKLRPVLVLTPDDEIEANSPIQVGAITTAFREPPPRDHVAIP